MKVRQSGGLANNSMNSMSAVSYDIYHDDKDTNTNNNMNNSSRDTSIDEMDTFSSRHKLSEQSGRYCCSIFNVVVYIFNECSMCI